MNSFAKKFLSDLMDEDIEKVCHTPIEDASVHYVDENMGADVYEEKKLSAGEAAQRKQEFQDQEFVIYSGLKKPSKMSIESNEFLLSKFPPPENSASAKSRNFSSSATSPEAPPQPPISLLKSEENDVLYKSSFILLSPKESRLDQPDQMESINLNEETEVKVKNLEPNVNDQPQLTDFEDEVNEAEMISSFVAEINEEKSQERDQKVRTPDNEPEATSKENELEIAKLETKKEAESPDDKEAEVLDEEETDKMDKIDRMATVNILTQSSPAEIYQSELSNLDASLQNPQFPNDSNQPQASATRSPHPQKIPPDSTNSQQDSASIPQYPVESVQPNSAYNKENSSILTEEPNLEGFDTMKTINSDPAETANDSVENEIISAFLDEGKETGQVEELQEADEPESGKAKEPEEPQEAEPPPETCPSIASKVSEMTLEAERLPRKQRRRSLQDGAAKEIKSSLVKHRRSVNENPADISSANFHVNNLSSVATSYHQQQAPYPKPEDLDLLLQLEAANKELSKDPKAAMPDASSTKAPSSIDSNYDWEFWGKVIAAEESCTSGNRIGGSKKFILKLIQGIPRELHGSVWMVLCQGRDSQLEQEYKGLLSMPSQYERMIKRDLSRTFPTLEFFNGEAIGQELLFNVIKTYSIYDSVVGYCQGVSFVMPDEQAFCCLVRLMFDYGLRNLYMPGMEGLQQRLFVFDKLLEDHLPDLVEYFQKEGIQSNMYASQWFLTLFSYKFPMEIVFRIFDMIFSEGLDVIYRIAICLLSRNASFLLELKFEELIDCLKHRLHIPFLSDPSVLTRQSLFIQISKRKLDKLYKEYEEKSKTNPRLADHNTLQALRTENLHLREVISSQKMNIERLDGEITQSYSQQQLEKQEFNQLQEKFAATIAEHEQIMKESLEASNYQIACLQKQLAESEKKVEDLTAELFAISGLLVGKFQLKISEQVRNNELMQTKVEALESALIQTKIKQAESEAKFCNEKQNCDGNR